MKARFKEYTLQFKTPAGTSRGVYLNRTVWFIFLEDGDSVGIGECAPLPGLSIEDIKKMNEMLFQVCNSVDYFIENMEELKRWPSIQFGIETALFDLKNKGKRLLFPSGFTNGENGIPINGLIWMGDPKFMKQQIRDKISAGFHCIKMKIGALDFNSEYEILRSIREEFSLEEITLRVDANGSYSLHLAKEYLKYLSDIEIHSIEQPIKAGKPEEMAKLCLYSPVPIALDEELIGITDKGEKERLLQIIKPQYLILKPSLHGGITGCEEWIELTKKDNIGWWITSALESNIGLNAIAQWTYTLNNKLEQGLGTGQLFTNNIESPLIIEGEQLYHRPDKNWGLTNIYL